jgi:hypothetical protein
MLPAGDQTAAARDVELTGAVMTVTDIVLARPFEFETIKGASPEDVDEYQWTRIRRLKSGTTIFLIVDGSPEVKRELLSATESSLVVRDPKAPRPETVSRADVVQVRAPKDRSGGRKFLGGIAGYFLGGFAGGFLGAIIGSAAGGNDAALGGMVLGMATGLVTGIVVGVRGGFRRPYEVIYIRRAIARLTQPPSGGQHLLLVLA